MWFVGNDLRDLLTSNSALTEIVGDDIYPIIAPENTKGPFVLYERSKYKKDYSKMGLVEQDCHITFTIVAEDYDVSLAIAELIDFTLTGDHKTEGCSMTIELFDSSEGFDDNKYYQSLTFSIK